MTIRVFVLLNMRDQVLVYTTRNEALAREFLRTATEVDPNTAIRLHEATLQIGREIDTKPPF